MPQRISTGARNAMVGSVGLKAGLDGGFIFLFSGPQPANADAAATGTLLAVISASGGATGLTLDAPVAGVLSKAVAEAWQGVGIAAGQAGWYRFEALDTDKATTQANALLSSSSAVRVDGAVAVSGGQLNMSNTTIVVGATQTLSAYALTQPAG